MSDTAETPKVWQCPICEKETLSQHCADSNPPNHCGWVTCSNTKCLARLDMDRGIGVHKDLDGEKDTRPDQKGAVQYHRVELREDGVWHGRAYG